MDSIDLAIYRLLIASKKSDKQLLLTLGNIIKDIKRYNLRKTPQEISEDINTLLDTYNILKDSSRKSIIEAYFSSSDKFSNDKVMEFNQSLDNEDHYAVLKVAKDVSSDELKLAMKKRLIFLRRTSISGESYDNSFNRLLTAYEVLNNSDKKRAYDQGKRLIKTHNTKGK